MPRSLNPHLCELPPQNGYRRWRCDLCGQVLELPEKAEIVATATALGVFAAAHRHTEKFAALLASNPT